MVFVYLGVNLSILYFSKHGVNLLYVTDFTASVPISRWCSLQEMFSFSPEPASVILEHICSTEGFGITLSSRLD